ncbi:MAG: PKD domain-containing protein [Bacteroidales bacterium]
MVRLSRLVIVVCVVALAGSACTMKNTEVPSPTGPSELGMSLSLFANPDIVNQDGASQSQIVIYARDQGGQPVKNMLLRIDLGATPATSNMGKLSSQSISTDADGRATLLYTAAEPVTGDPGTVITVKVRPVGTDYTTSLTRTVDIRLVPPALPVAFFTYVPVNPSVDSNVTFDATGSKSSDGATISTYSWTFGDGSRGTGPKPVHAYSKAGPYTVTLTVMDTTGKTGATSRSLYVQ